MVKKGKFKLFSYFLEDYLIFYSSLNKNKKIIAFSIFEFEEINTIISNLNEFLDKRFLKYYSIQINVIKKDRKICILNLEDNEKDRIIKIFNLIFQKLIAIKTKISFLKCEILEKRFISIITSNLTPNLKIQKSTNSILLLLNQNFIKIFDFYRINLRALEENQYFLQNFLKLIKDIRRKGFLIFNFKKDLNDELTLMAYFIDIKKKNKDLVDIEKEINNFSNFELIKKQNLDINELYCILWRYEIGNNPILFKKISELFLYQDTHNFYTLMEFNSFFEDTLIENGLKFKRLSKNLFLIEDSSLFFIFSNLKFKLVLKILKKYISKYQIYFLILDKKECDNLLKIEKINLLKNVKIICPRMFSKFNIKILKNT